MRITCASVLRFYRFSMFIGKPSPIFSFSLFSPAMPSWIATSLGRASFLSAMHGERKSKEGGEIGAESGKMTYFFFAWASALVPRSFAARPSQVLSNYDLLDSKKKKKKKKTVGDCLQSNAERNYKFTFHNKFLAVKQQRHPYFYIVFNIPFAVKRN